MTLLAISERFTKRRCSYFENLLSQQRTDIVNFRQDTALLVPRAVLKVERYSALTPSPLMPTHVETLPTSVLTKQDASKIAFHSPPGLEGAWQILHVATYVNGGRIFYRDINDDYVEAAFRFYGEAPDAEANQAA